MSALALSGVSFAADAKDAAGSKKPYDITSDSLEVTKEEIVFVGNVKVLYNEIKINADNVKLLHETKDEKSVVKTIIATGNVNLLESDREAWAGKMVFERGTGVITLTGDPKIKENNNIVAADTITVFLNEDKVAFKGNVKAVINPEDIK